jgi:hypothetical protein
MNMAAAKDALSLRHTCQLHDLFEDGLTLSPVRQRVGIGNTFPDEVFDLVGSHENWGSCACAPPREAVAGDVITPGTNTVQG